MASEPSSIDFGLAVRRGDRDPPSRWSRPITMGAFKLTETRTISSKLQAGEVVTRAPAASAECARAGPGTRPARPAIVIHLCSTFVVGEQLRGSPGRWPRCRQGRRRAPPSGTGPCPRRPAAGCTPILALVFLLQITHQLLATELYYSKKTFWLPLMSAVGLAVNVGVAVWAAPRFGVVGVAWAYVASVAAYVALGVWFSRRTMVIPYDWAGMVRSVVIGATVFAITLAFDPGNALATGGGRIVWCGYVRRCAGNPGRSDVAGSGCVSAGYCRSQQDATRLRTSDLCKWLERPR